MNWLGFQGRGVKVKVTARSNIWVNYCSELGRRSIIGCDCARDVWLQIRRRDKWPNVRLHRVHAALIDRTRNVTGLAYIRAKSSAPHWQQRTLSIRCDCGESKIYTLLVRRTCYPPLRPWFAGHACEYCFPHVCHFPNRENTRLFTQNS